MQRNSMRENRETPSPPAGREERAMSHKRATPAEVVEGRPLTKENTPEPNSHRTPCRGSGRSGLERVREAAKQNGKLKHGTAAPRKHRPAAGELLQPEEKGGAGSGRDDVG